LVAACRRANPAAEVIVCGTVDEALGKVAEDQLVVVTGSLYLVGEALEHLKAAPVPPMGERPLNEWAVSR
jgi:folylpolyglutamate synthase/dihydropteroate synthase